MMLLAAMHRIPTVVFEPNVEPGFTNRVLAGIATRVAVAQQETAGRLGSQGDPYRLPGSPGVFRHSAEGASPAVHAADHRRKPRRFTDQSGCG